MSDYLRCLSLISKLIKWNIIRADYVQSALKRCNANRTQGVAPFKLVSRHEGEQSRG